MNRSIKVLAAAAALAWGARASAAGEEKLAKDLAAMLIAGRAVIAANQPLINDAAKGDKGFTPDVLATAVKAELKAKGGVDVGALDPARENDRRLLALFEAERQVVAEAQPVINAAGKGFKAFTPAIFGFRVAERFAARTGIFLKQTSMLYRNPKNRPDELETKVLALLANPAWERGVAYREVVEVGGTKILRLLQPLYIARPCLSCHGDPKGEKDVSGHAKEGYKEGELRGAVSVSVAVAK